MRSMAKLTKSSSEVCWKVVGGTILNRACPPVGPQVHDVKWFAFCVSICIQTMARS